MYNIDFDVFEVWFWVGEWVDVVIVVYFYGFLVDMMWFVEFVVEYDFLFVEDVV